ncbi:hypothetical protein [Oscillatoria sp. FACHB-1406]|uniref:hypothetical protein n=1 Tax=Oscillatoria sp. FACHB-1406 TaxID=2692846 RepID=UPI001687F0D2|nr:hypothetical protein [Oscillatoria sp. FACHB-1406]MBD2576282.1 hypothetical protein [Oscillatoria sp. FACHB-1406]
MSNTRTQPPQSTKTAPANINATNVPHRASVPISVYRELANELQAAEERLNTLKDENQQLLQQNRRLRQEATRLFVSAQQLQQLVTSSDEYGKPLPVISPVRLEEPADLTPHSQSVSPENWVMEVEEKASYRPSAAKGSSEISGWVLATAVGLIVLTALGLGFLAMRFVMSSKNS